MGDLDRGQKVYVEKVDVLFRSPKEGIFRHDLGLRRAGHVKTPKRGRSRLLAHALAILHSPGCHNGSNL